jgi:hypothetical protein
LSTFDVASIRAKQLWCVAGTRVLRAAPHDELAVGWRWHPANNNGRQSTISTIAPSRRTTNGNASRACTPQVDDNEHGAAIDTRVTYVARADATLLQFLQSQSRDVASSSDRQRASARAPKATRHSNNGGERHETYCRRRPEAVARDDNAHRRSWRAVALVSARQLLLLQKCFAAQNASARVHFRCSEQWCGRVQPNDVASECLDTSVDTGVATTAV